MDKPTRFGWSGADCSQRTCPLGKTFDIVDTTGAAISPVVFKPAAPTSQQHLRITFAPQNRTNAFKSLMKDVTFNIKVMSASNTGPNYGTFAWKLDEDEYYEPESYVGDASSESNGRGLNKINLADGTQVTTAQTGVFVWWDPTFAGSSGFSLVAGDVYTFTLNSHGNLDFIEGDSNTAHQEAECSGRGTCDSSSGKCNCLPGFTGEACQRSEYDGAAAPLFLAAATNGRYHHSPLTFVRLLSPLPLYSNHDHLPVCVCSHLPLQLLRPWRVPVRVALRGRGGHQDLQRRPVQVLLRLRRREELRLQVRRRIPRGRLRIRCVTSGQTMALRSRGNALSTN